MNEDDNKKSGGLFDKLVMGAIIGGAIGSVLGLTLAPKKGKETRKALKKKTKQIKERAQQVHGEFMEEHGKEVEKITKKAKKHSKKFFSGIGKRVTDAFEKRKELLHHSPDEIQEWDIPDESDMN